MVIRNMYLALNLMLTEETGKVIRRLCLLSTATAVICILHMNQMSSTSQKHMQGNIIIKVRINRFLLQHREHPR